MGVVKQEDWGAGGVLRGGERCGWLGEVREADERERRQRLGSHAQSCACG